MKHLKHSPGLILIALLALTFLSACGGSASAPAATPISTVASVAGEFVGVTHSADTIGLSTNGKQIIAYACDGFPKQKHAITYAAWFKGAVSHNVANLTSANGSHLVVTLSGQAASGRVTMSNGHSFSFAAPAVTSVRGAGLYRTEKTFAGVHYLAGWIIPTTKQVALPAPASSALASMALLNGWLIPFSPAMIGPEPEGGRGGIINEQTRALLALPVLTGQDFAARQELVPNLGTFPMKQCQQGQC